MTYKKPQQSTKKFLPPDFINIPMPNEKEASYGYHGGRKKQHGLSSVIGFLRERIKLEELILIGLIIILLDESIEDDLLLIILAYILLF